MSMDAIVAELTAHPRHDARAGIHATQILSKGDRKDIQLPDDAQLECVNPGNKVSRKKGGHRILDVDKVATLIRHDSHLDKRPVWFAKHRGRHHDNHPTYATPMARLGNTHADFQTTWQSLVHNGRRHTKALATKHCRTLYERFKLTPLSTADDLPQSTINLW